MKAIPRTLVPILVVALLPALAWAQAPGKYTPPRTPWGDPDISGLWPANDMQGTPYERPEELGTRATLNDKEFAARQDARSRQVKADSEVYVPAGQRAGIGGPSHWAAGERGVPAAAGLARRRSVERTHSGDDRGRQEAHRAGAEH